IMIYHPQTREKLDTSACNGTNVEVEIPLKAKGSLKLDRYQALKSENIDIFDPESPAFNDRCFSHTDSTTGLDTTLNSRRKEYYSNMAITCSPGCSYTELARNSSTVKCNCQGIP